METAPPVLAADPGKALPAIERPALAVPPRPDRPLGPVTFLRTVMSDTLSVCDERVYEEPIVVRRLAGFPVVFVSEPAAVRRILVETPENYPRLGLIRRLYAAEIGTGTLASMGEVWERHRRVGAPSVDRRAIAGDLPHLIRMAEAAADDLAAAVGTGPVDIEKHVTRLFTAMLNQVFTGSDPRGLPVIAWLARVPRNPRLLDLVPLPDRIADLVSPTRRTPERAAGREGLIRLVRERLDPAYAGPRDMIWRIAHGLDRRTGRGLAVEEIRDEAATLATAGDATIRGLTWLFYLLALHPQVEARLHAELDAVLGAAPLRPEQLGRLPYTRRVVDEALRLYPPIPMIVRSVRRSDTVLGHRIPRGAVLFVAPFVIHRHRTLWRDPDSFDPDRFAPEESAGRSRYAYLPFSAGPRICTGAQLALTEIMLVAATFARRYRFRLDPGRTVVPRGRVSLRPRGGLWVTVERR
ncbi:cytochrome P450 [Roseomonas sp. CCTCC AB2023176]|uniref:cytochrome P450 n=1 Tax=Roseomonas sp. CCTCC AB2023176 TaxID=3342640 RepID=UPI0035D92468